MRAYDQPDRRNGRCALDAVPIDTGAPVYELPPSGIEIVRYTETAAVAAEDFDAFLANVVERMRGLI